MTLSLVGHGTRQVGAEVRRRHASANRNGIRRLPDPVSRAVTADPLLPERLKRS